MLSPDQIEFFHINGYLGVDNVLAPEEVAELQRVTDDFVEQSRQFTKSTDVFDLEPGHTPARPRLRRLKNPMVQHPIYNQVRCHERILEILSQLIGPNIRYSGNKLNMKSAEGGSAVEWHQDWAFHPHTNDDYLTVGVAIDDMTLENGALLVIPGSHQGPIHDHHQDGIFVGAVVNPKFDQSTDAWPLMWTPTWDDFNAAILRGEPNQEPRLTAVPVRLPLPTIDPTAVIFELQGHLKQPVFGKKAN